MNFFTNGPSGDLVFLSPRWYNRNETELATTYRKCALLSTWNIIKHEVANEMDRKVHSTTRQKVLR